MEVGSGRRKELVLRQSYPTDDHVHICGQLGRCVPLIALGKYA